MDGSIGLKNPGMKMFRGVVPVRLPKKSYNLCCFLAWGQIYFNP